ncbi:MAG: double-strand break repair helicase AddA [Magnetovibrio sp.]|nr:double-strand break repair helicase AddA [Magnetovibrio sp.]
MSTFTPNCLLADGTIAQLSAADPTHSAWVSANAGTGKTRVLIDRISRLLLEGTPAHRILCLTFTKAAAAEMSNRLSERLGHWATLKEMDIKKDLNDLLGRPAMDIEIKRAPKLFAEMMELPEGLRIRTIHSFCESLLSRFPLESGVAPHFTVIDERRAAELRLESRDHVLQKASGNQETEVSEALYHLAGLIDEEEFARIMAELDAGKHKLYAMSEANGGLDALITASNGELGLSSCESSETIIQDASKDIALNQNILLKTVAVLQYGSKKDIERAEYLDNWLRSTEKERATQFFKQYLPIFLTQKGQPLKSLITSKLAKANPWALEALKVEQNRVFMITEKLKAITIAENTKALLTVGSELLDTYLSLKKTRALIDYDDLIAKAHKLLGSPSDVSWVHFKLDGGLDHILVDEAQDTSPMQWSIIEGLADDFFSSKKLSGQRQRTIFAVGDEKQSIYSFQGAEPAQFGTIGEKLGNKAKIAGNTWRHIEMALSWRSTPAILSAVDAVFTRDDAADGLSWDGRAVQHLWSREGEGGLVELWPLSELSSEGNDSPWDAPLDQVSSASPEVRLAEKISDTISGWIESAEMLSSQGRAITPGDIMILVRNRGTFAEEMVRALKDRNIPVAGRDRISMAEHLAVMDLIAAGRFVLLAEDDLNTATVLKGPFIEMDEAALFSLAYERKNCIWDELAERHTEKQIFNEAYTYLSKLRVRADQMPPYEFFSALLMEGGRKSLLARLGPEASDPIDEFLALTLDFEHDHIPSLEAFLHWITQGQTEVKRDPEQSEKEVRIMTVHGAKGLQSRIVFLADTCSIPSQRQANKIRWGDKSVFWPALKENEESITSGIAATMRTVTEREYRRLLYVAMTRAEDRLYVCGWKGANEIPEHCWYQLVKNGLNDLANTQIIKNEDEEIFLRFTSPQTSTQKAKVSTQFTETKDVALPDWIGKIPSPEPYPVQPLTASDPEREHTVRSPISKNNGPTFKRGLLIHTLLETLPDLEPAKRPEAARQFLNLPTHKLNPEEQKATLREVLSILENPKFAILFGPDSLAEVPIIGTLAPSNGAPPILVSGQVDRLCISEKEIVIIDYKSNRPPPDTPENVSPSYLRQMAIYRALLQAIYPGRTMRASILWTDSTFLMDLPENLLDIYTP